MSTDDLLIAEAREHYWLRYRRPGMDWTDLDSAFPDADPGKARASAEERFSPEAVREDRYHHLQVGVILRIAQVGGDRDGSTSDTVMLEQEIRVADLQGAGILLANQPNPTSDLLAGGKTLSEALQQVKGYQVVLQIGSNVTRGKYFDLGGKISDGPQAAETPGPAGFGNALSGLGGGLLGGLGGGRAPSLLTKRRPALSANGWITNCAHPSPLAEIKSAQFAAETSSDRRRISQPVRLDPVDRHKVNCVGG